MLATVWGCRGSLAAPGADTVRYGGNTSCIEVRTESGDLIVLDAGTGIRALGAEVERDPPATLHIFLTHLHMDHLQGLGFFRPLFRPNAEIHVWGPASPVKSLADRIATYMSPPLFPVRLADLPSRVTFHDASEDPIAIGSVTVRAGEVAHQGPTVGYRIDEGPRSLAYVPDHEPALGIDLNDLDPAWISGYGVARDVDVLFHDAQYGDHEYPAHVGWGHSAMAHVMAFSRKANARTTVLFHHDPYHTDDELDTMLDSALEQWHATRNDLRLAHEGMTVTLGADGIAFS